MLVDTSVLIRALQPNHSFYTSAERAIRILPEQGWNLHIVAQNLIELWTVATRPLGLNGLGLTTAEAASELERIKSTFLLLPETPASDPAWEALVIRHQVTGKPRHDARLVAAMQVHTAFSPSPVGPIYTFAYHDRAELERDALELLGKKTGLRPKDL